MIEVKGHPNLFRDPETNVIHNVDRAGIERARQAKEARKRQKAEKASLESRIDSLETQLQQVNAALQILINRD